MAHGRGGTWLSKNVKRYRKVTNPYTNGFNDKLAPKRIHHRNSSPREASFWLVFMTGSSYNR